MVRKHPYHSRSRRWTTASILVGSVMLVGTLGMHWIEGMPLIDAFYFTTMFATAQGSNIAPATTLGKIFAAILAFVSVGVVITSFGFLFGPLLGKLFHVGIQNMEKEMKEKE